MSSSPALVRHEEAAVVTTTASDPAATAPVVAPTGIGMRAGRWYRLNSDRIRATLIGIVSLVVFLLVLLG